MREHEHEPVPGLPERLPAGERVLWQGAPDWRDLLRRTFRMRALALYFAVLAAWRGALLAAEGASAAAVASGAVWLLALGAVPVGLVTAFAVLSARTTLYTVTNRRVVMRVGVALPMTVNLPFSVLRSAGLRRYAGGGDILLELEPPHRASYVALWPHVRGTRLARPEPMLRALRDAEAAAQALSHALAETLPMAAPAPAAPVRVPAPATALA